MIHFLCNHCGAPLRVPPDRAGVTRKCPRCAKPVEAPTDGGLGAGSSSSVPQARDVPGTFEADSGSGREECDFLAPAQSPDELGRLGNYRVLKALGSGGMGVVFQAEDVKLRRQVALKVMKKAQAVNPINRDRFLREAQAAAAIEHDHIVPIYQVDEDRGVPFLAMKLLVGESLEDRLNREGKLPTEQVLRIGMEIAEGLAAAHERGLMHRDIKPANIWLEEGRDRVRIVDFGLARTSAVEEDARLTQENFLVGTPMYMSPEQASGDTQVDGRTDLFSLGSVLYRMSTGELPFKGKTTLNVLTALATKKPKQPCKLNPEVPRRLSDLIMQLLQKKRDERPRNARMVVAALADIRDTPEEEEVVEDVAVEEEEEIVELDPEPDPEPRSKPESRSRFRTTRGGKRRRSEREEETDEDRLARKVIKFAIFAGVCVFLLLAALVIQKVFFKEKDEPPTPPSRSTVMSSRTPARSEATALRLLRASASEGRSTLRSRTDRCSHG